MNLVERLVTLKRGGCTVRVAANPKRLHAPVRKRLRDANIPMRLAKTHDKYILVNARFAGSAERRKLVFTGSHNWTSSANSRNDELFVRVEGDRVYGRFLDHFEATWAAGDPP